MSDEQQPKRHPAIQKVIDAVGKEAAEDAFALAKRQAHEEIYRALGRAKVMEAISYCKQVDVAWAEFEKQQEEAEKPDIHIASPGDLPQ